MRIFTSLLSAASCFIAPTAVIITLAGCSDQQTAETRERAAEAKSRLKESTTADTVTVSQDVSGAVSRMKELVSGLNAAIDFIKQPEVLISCAAVAWDLVVIDEAHALAPGTERLVAAQAIGRSARRVLLLTGTPHSGDDDGFAKMGGVGELAGDELPLVVIRRTGESVGHGRQRRVRSLRPRAHPSESQVHELLDNYVRRVWAAEPDDPYLVRSEHD